jgi:hypothetical protein
MVRIAMLATLAAALWAAAPAQAGALPGSLDTTATTAVQQTTATVAAVTQAVPGTTTSAPEAPSAEPVVRTAAAAAGAATETASTTADAAVPPPPAAHHRVLRDSVQGGHLTHPKALSSTRDRGPARTGRAGRARPQDRVGDPRSDHGASSATVPPSARSQADGAASLRASAGASRDHRPASPEPVPAAGGGAVASAAAGFAAGGLALLAAAVCLAGPRLRRRLFIPPRLPRPVAFVALLERPG